MKTSIPVFVSALMFCSCSNVEDLKNDGSPFISLYAEVGRGTGTRTVTGVDGQSSFEENDCIGLFVPFKATAAVWKYDGNKWNTSSSTAWDNKEERFEFCAFYPCTNTSTTKDAIPMPDLSSQSGKLSDIGKYDFLVGRCTTSYNENNGIVSFSGENSFKHVYSLLHVEIADDGTNKASRITGWEFKGDGIVKKHKYVFGETAGDDRLVSSDASNGSNLKIDYTSPITIEGKYEVVALFNSVSLDIPLEFSLYYEKDGKSHVAKAGLLHDLKSGSYNKVKLNWVNGGLKITSNEISDWNISQLDDVLLQGGSI